MEQCLILDLLVNLQDQPLWKLHLCSDKTHMQNFATLNQAKETPLSTPTVTQLATLLTIIFNHLSQVSQEILPVITTIWIISLKAERPYLQYRAWMAQITTTVWLRTFISKYHRISRTKMREDILNLYSGTKIQELSRASLPMMCCLWGQSTQILMIWHRIR